MRAAATAALGLALALAGAAFGSPSLLVPGIALLGLALGAWAWVEAAAAGARLRPIPGPRRIVEGDSYPLAIETSGGLLPPPGGELRDPLLAAPVRRGPLGPRRVAIRVRLERRGRYPLGAAVWTIRDPLGLRERVVRAPSGGELLVLPRILPLRAARLGLEGAGAGAAQAGEDVAASVREARAVDFEIDGLRPYRPGTPAARIHWPALARSGEMHERRLVAGADALPLVVLDAERPDDDEALDRAVRAAASLCVHLAAGGGCSILLPGHRAPAVVDQRLRTWPQIHAWLALVRPGQPTALAGRALGAGSLFWVTAGEAGRAARLARGLAPGSHHLVSSRRVPGRRPAFEVAGCAAYPLTGRRPGRAAGARAA